MQCLYQKELIAIDGSKFRAVNSKQKSSYNKDTLKKKLLRIDENISGYLSQMDGYHCCYNVQTAVDNGSHLIAEYEVTNCCTDQGLLKKVADSTREALEVEILEIIADKGYESRRDIENCVMNGIVPNVALKYDKDERLYTVDYVEAEISEEEKCSTKPKDIQKCIAAGVLPYCYENTAIEVEIQEQSLLSCFTLNEDGTVTCPMGNILSRVKQRGKNTIYANKDACRQCPNRCTGGKGFKTVSFSPDTKYVAVRMYGDIRYQLNKIPEGIPLNPFNHGSMKRGKSLIKEILTAPYASITSSSIPKKSEKCTLTLIGYCFCLPGNRMAGTLSQN